MQLTIEQALKTGVCQVTYLGNEMHIISPFLLNEKNAWDNVGAIHDLHVLRYCILDDMQNDSNVNLKECAQLLQEIEFELQDLWGYPRDARFYRFWNVPKCTCPKMDNDDYYPTGRYIIDKECPVHGESTK